MKKGLGGRVQSAIRELRQQPEQRGHFRLLSMIRDPRSRTQRIRGSVYRIRRVLAWGGAVVAAVHHCCVLRYQRSLVTTPGALLLTSLIPLRAKIVKSCERLRYRPSPRTLDDGVCCRCCGRTTSFRRSEHAGTPALLPCSSVARLP